jgi:hypothetical protein
MFCRRRPLGDTGSVGIKKKNWVYIARSRLQMHISEVDELNINVVIRVERRVMVRSPAKGPADRGTYTNHFEPAAAKEPRMLSLNEIRIQKLWILQPTTRAQDRSEKAALMLNVSRSSMPCTLFHSFPLFLPWLRTCASPLSLLVRFKVALRTRLTAGLLLHVSRKQIPTFNLGNIKVPIAPHNET